MVILGASFDTPAENKAFAEGNGFGFRLLSDVDRVAGRAYETVRAPEEQLPEWAKRRTFVIDPSGTIARVYRVKDAGVHAAEVLEDVRAMIAG